MAIGALQILLALAYPLLVFFGLRTMEPRQLGLGLLVLVFLRMGLVRPTRLLAYARSLWLPMGCVGLVALGATVSNHPVVLLLAPTLISWSLLLVFARTLLRGPPIVEQFARVQAGFLSPAERIYCRTVTVVWCGFLFFNGAVALGLTLSGTIEAWTWYTGLIGYLLIGILFAAELTVRRWRFRRYRGAPSDVVFRWIFPPSEGSASDGLEPEVLADRNDDGSRELELRIPRDLACWPGHFPGFALVPGVLQLDWVMRFIGEWTGSPVRVDRIEGLKFKTPLRPEQRVTLFLERCPQRSFRFRIEHEAEVCSLGRVHVSEDADRD